MATANEIDYKKFILNIPSIIAGLHQSGIDECQNTLNAPPLKEAECRLTNSAMEGEGAEAKLNAAGEQIIYVIAAKPEKIEDDAAFKTACCKAIQEYVRKFVGPDLEKEVTEGILMPLEGSVKNGNTSSDDKTNSESKDESSSDNASPESSNSKDANAGDNSSEQSQTTNESTIQVKTFAQFILESTGINILNEADDSTAENNPEQPPSTENSNSEIDQPSSDNKDSSQTTTSSDSSNKIVGWYVGYKLIAKGIKEHSFINSVKNVAKNIFDELTITPAGIFGTGQSFTGKDIRKAIHDFSKIDPEKLKRNIQVQFTKSPYKGHFNTEPRVDIVDKNIIFREVRSYLNREQLKMFKLKDKKLSNVIQIEVQENDPRKPFLNSRKIADIVRSSISFFRIFKKINLTSDKVIHIRNYIKKTNVDDKVAKDEKSILGRDQIAAILEKGTIKQIYDKLINIFTGSGKSLDKLPSFSKSALIKHAVDIWQDFSKKHKRKELEDDPALARVNDLDQIKAYFKDFIDPYYKFCRDYNINHESTLRESRYCFENSFTLYTKEKVICSLIESLFESGLNESDEDSKSLNDLKDQFLKNVKESFKAEKTPRNLCDTITNVYDWMTHNKVSDPDLDDTNYTHAMAVLFSHKYQMTESIDHELFKMLFESDDSYEFPTSEQIFNKIFKPVLDFGNITDYSNIEIRKSDRELKDLGESLIVEADSIEDICKKISDAISNRIREEISTTKSKSLILTQLNTKFCGEQQQVLDYLNNKIGLADQKLIDCIKSKKYSVVLSIKVSDDSHQGTMDNEYITDKAMKQLVFPKVFKNLKPDEYTVASAEGLSTKQEYNKTNKKANIRVFVAAFDDIWNADPDKEPTKTSSQKAQAYVVQFNLNESDDDKTAEIVVTFKAPTDPTKPAENLKEIKVSKGKPGNIEEPKPAEYEKPDFKFVKWDPNPQELTENGEVVAQYEQSEVKGPDDEIESPEDDSESKDSGADLYLIPMEGLEDFNDSGSDGNEDA